MENVDLNFKPQTYFESGKNQITIVKILFSKHIEINLKIRGNEKEFEFFITDNVDEEEFKYQFKNYKSQTILSFKEIINIIQKDIRDCEGKNNIIFNEWDFQYYEYEMIDISVRSNFYPNINSYFENIFQNIRTDRPIR